MLICGAWMVIQPFVLRYGGTLRTWHIVLGAVVALLALLEIWQDRNRALEA
ncbi:SPW repeat protein [Rhizobiaceae sp. 2RAB30]